MTLTAEQQQLVTQARPLVLHCLIRYADRFPVHAREDAIADGLVGLCRAATTYDPAKGAAFSTYATRRSLGAMIDGVRRRDHMTREDRRKWNREAAAADEHGDPRPANEAPMSLSYPVHQDGHEPMELGDVLPDPAPGAETELVREERDQRLATAVARLPEREQLVIRRYFWHGETMAQIGTLLGVTESRVSQMRTRALDRLRPQLRDAA